MKLYITETGVQLPPAPPPLYFSYSNFSIKAIIQFFYCFSTHLSFSNRYLVIT
nr:MAG TPA: hypothetical protein [Caudoviricetes sp.]